MVDKIPYDVLFVILSFVQSDTIITATQVCKEWQQTLSATKKLSLSAHTRITDRLILNCLFRFNNVTYLDISACKNISQTGFACLFHQMPALECLIATHLSISNRSLRELCKVNTK